MEDHGKKWGENPRTAWISVEIIESFEFTRMRPFQDFGGSHPAPLRERSAATDAKQAPARAEDPNRAWGTALAEPGRQYALYVSHSYVGSATAQISGAGQQQVRNLWTNIAVFNLNLWVHTLLECWAWNKPVEEICDRKDSPWDDSQRRPSHADRRKALRRETLQNQYSSLSRSHRQSSKTRTLFDLFLNLAA